MELLFHQTSQLGAGHELVIYGIPMDAGSVVPWLSFAVVAAIGIAAIRKTYPLAAGAWNTAIDQARARAAQ